MNDEDLSKWPTVALISRIKELRDERDRLYARIAAEPRTQNDPKTTDQAFADLASRVEELVMLKTRHKAVRTYARRKIYEAADEEERYGAVGAHDEIIKASVARRVLMILDGEAGE